MKTTATNDIFSPANAGRKFVPTPEEWKLIYARHFARIVDWLKCKCGEDDAKDCVQSAYQKILGLSRSRLEKPLQPLTVSGWALFVHQQAEWILGHERAKNSQWVSAAETTADLAKEIEGIQNDTELTSRQRADVLRSRRRLLRYLVGLEDAEERSVSPVDSIDGNICAQRFRSLFEAVCNKHRVSAKVREAFLRVVIGEESSTAVVLAVWGYTDDEGEIETRKGNLYRIKNRIIGYLLSFAKEWKRNGGSYNSFLEAA